MEFLKKHYEKVILSVVLLGLLVAAALLPIWVANEKRALEEIENSIISTPRKELKPVNVSTNEATLQRLQKPEHLRLSSGHNVFNPVLWKRRPDGTLLKIQTGTEEGPAALTITGISPLYLRIEFDGAVGTGDNLQYRFKITREAERSPGKRAPTTRSVPNVGSKNDVFLLKEMKPKDNPAEFVLELADTKETVTVTKDKPFSQVAGYIANLKYDPEKMTFLNRRLDDRLIFASDTNKIVAITATNVTVEALSNTKRTTITYKGAP
jgi:hypothetical protein